jgi:membrane protein
MEHVKALIRVIRELGERTGRDDLGAYGAALAYNFMFATGPLLLFLTALLGMVHVQVVALLSKGPLPAIIPAGVLSIVRSALETATRDRNGAVLGLGVVGFLWGMSGAFRQIIDAMNHAYEFPRPLRRGTLQLYLLSVSLGAAVGIILAIGVLLAVLGREFTLWLMTVHILPPALAGAALVLRWLLLLFLLIVVLDILYAYAPDRPRPFRWLTPGAVFALAGWLILSAGFSVYASHFASYNRVYGTLGGIILLLLYLYLSGMALLMGALVNAMWEERRL